MPSCVRCREELEQPDANYCGNCSFPILNDLSEQEVRERARRELSGFLDGFDVRTLRNVKDGDQPEPSQEYQYYLEEGVRQVFEELAFLQVVDWFDKEPIIGLFLHEELFEVDDPTEEVMNDYLVWARVSSFIYEAFQPVGIEFSIQLGALLVEDIDTIEEVDVSISIGPQDESEDSDITGPAS